MDDACQRSQVARSHDVINAMSPQRFEESPESHPPWRSEALSYLQPSTQWTTAAGRDDEDAAEH